MKTFWGLGLTLLLIPRLAAALEITMIDLEANDLIYSRWDGFLYASVPGDVPVYGNSIVRINPVTAAIGPSLPIGSEPGKLALSNDGAALYVALNGAAAVRKVDLGTFTAGLQFGLGSDDFFGPFYAEDIAVQPGNPDVVAVSLMNLGISPRHAGVAVFEDGVARPERTQRHTGSNRIEYSSNPARVYGYNNETTEYGFRRLVVDGNGIHEIDVARDLISGSQDIHYDQGRIYGTNGQVIDPEARTLLGTFPFPDFTFGTVAAPDSNRAYFVSGFSGPSELHEFDTATFTLILRQPLAFQGTPRVLVRWGVDGLALLTRDIFSGPPRIYVLKKIHEPPTSDLAVTQTDLADPLAPGSSATYRVVVRNQGPSPAADVWLRNTIPTGSSYQYSSPTRGSCYDSLGTVVCSFGGLTPEDSVVTHVTVLPPGPGLYENRAAAFSATLDLVPANNTSVEATEVRVPPNADVFVRLASGPLEGTVGQALNYSFWIGNRGPQEATPVEFSVTAYSATIQSVSSPRGSCTPNPFGYQCQFGTVVPSDSFLVTATLVAEQFGTVAVSAFVSGGAIDPDFSNNSAGLTTQIFPSSTLLIETVISLVRSYALRNGVEGGLMRPLDDAHDALVQADTSAACTALSRFESRVGQRAGRGLTVAQAFRLLEGSEVIDRILDCDERSARTTAAGPVRLSAEAVETQTEAPPRELAIGSIAETNGRHLLQLSMPRTSNARLDVLDVQGRRVGTLHDGELTAGVHRLVWSDAAATASGIYFLRLASGGRSVTTRIVVTR